MQLKDFPLLQFLDAAQLAQFESVVSYGDAPAGARLLEQGTRGEAMLLLLTGEVEVRMDAGRGEQAITSLPAPAVLGEMELLTGQPRSASVYATAACHYAKIDYATLHSRIEQADVVAFKFVHRIAQVLASRLAVLTRKLSELEAEDDDEQPRRAAELKAFKAKLFGEWST